MLLAQVAVRRRLLSLVFLLIASAATAQTAVTTSGGATNTMPIFTGSASLGDSGISQSGNTVLIGGVGGIAVSGENLDPNTGNSLTPFVNSAQVAVGWNYSGGGGEIDMMSNRGAGFTGGFRFYDLTNSGVANPLVTMLGNGNVGVGTTSPQAPLEISSGGANNNNAITNALSLHPAFGSAYYGNGSSIYLGSVTNDGINPLAGVWSSLINGGNGGVNYTGALVFGTTSSGTTAPSERMRIDDGGDVGIGTTSPGAKLEVDGNVKLSAGSGASITFADGTVQSTAYTGVACGGDYAESVDVTGDRHHYGPGDLLVLDPEHPGDVLKSAGAYSTAVAGIYSTKPGYVGRRQTGRKSQQEVPMAMVGIVPTHVTAQNGPIQVGDLLVASSTPGFAMKGTDRSRMLGAVVGKAMGNLNGGKGEIEVLVTLQ
jgi:hypothetical protein